MYFANSILLLLVVHNNLNELKMEMKVYLTLFSCSCFALLELLLFKVLFLLLIEFGLAQLTFTCPLPCFGC